MTYDVRLREPESRESETRETTSRQTRLERPRESRLRDATADAPRRAEPNFADSILVCGQGWRTTHATCNARAREISS